MYHPKLANFVILTSLLLVAGFGTGCNNLRHVDGATFMQIAAQSTMMNTMSSDQYIGATTSAAYVQSWRAGILLPDTNCVYWTGLSELPCGVAKKLRAGENPWADARPSWDTRPRIPHAVPEIIDITKKTDFSRFVNEYIKFQAECPRTIQTAAEAVYPNVRGVEIQGVDKYAGKIIEVTGVLFHVPCQQAKDQIPEHTSKFFLFDPKITVLGDAPPMHQVLRAPSGD